MRSDVLDPRGELDVWPQAAALVGRLTRAEEPADAVLAVTDFLSDRFSVPVVAWLGEEEPAPRLTADRGLGFAERTILVDRYPTLPAWEELAPLEWEALHYALSTELGIPVLYLIPAGDALLAVGADDALPGPMLSALGSVLADVLRHLRTFQRAKACDATLDLGIASAAHEIRGPLLAVRAALEVVKQGTGDTLEREKLLEGSLSQIAHLAVLVENLLNGLTGRASLEFAPNDIAALVKEVAEVSQLQWEGASRVEVEVYASPSVLGDASCLRSAIGNLIRNALVHSIDHGQVMVRVESKGDRAVIAVSDRGPGIGEATDSLFEPLVRGGPAATRTQGWGLGLFITRRLIEAHGGLVRSLSNGEGTTFAIELPASVVAEERRCISVG